MPRVTRRAFVLLVLLVLLCLPATASAANPILLRTFGSFAFPSGIAVDESTGNVFVADGGSENAVKIFGAEGEAPTGIANARIEGFAFNFEPSGVAVDNSPVSPSRGALYVADVAHNAVKKFKLNGATEEYELSEELSSSPSFSEPLGVAVDTKGNVYVADFGSRSILIFNPTGAQIGQIETGGFLENPSDVAVDSAGDIFVQKYQPFSGEVVKYKANASGEVEPGTPPVQVVSSGASGVAVDPTTETLFIVLGKHIEQFNALTLAKGESFGEGSLGASEKIAVNAETGRIYVTDRERLNVAVFGPPPPPCVPSVISESARATYTEAEFEAELEPCNDEIRYFIEYGPTEAYGQRTITYTRPAAYQPIKVTGDAFGLTPGSLYHYRVVVENSIATDAGPDRSFQTLVRREPGLPDHRAYELVSPPDTNGTFLGMLSDDDVFETNPVTPDGESVIYSSVGLIPGMEGNGLADEYLSTRFSTGWRARTIEPSGTQARYPTEGGTSADHGFTFWTARGGTLNPSTETPYHYVRLPNGEFELVGEGDLGSDPQAMGRWITPGGGHIVFSTQPGIAVKLEENAPEDGVAAVYDRSLGGPTQLVSILPDGSTPSTNAEYIRASVDGTAVVFAVGLVGAQKTYVRLNNQKTLEIPDENVTFEGISQSGSRVFYLAEQASPWEGNIYVFEPATETRKAIGSGDQSIVLNVSADGSHVFFESPLQLDAGKGEAGQPNLYVWDGSSVHFIATISPSDIEGGIVSLMNWYLAMGPIQTSGIGRGNVPSRSTPDGDVFAFQSRGVVGYPFNSDGHSEIYLYNGADEALTCVSCPPGPATGEAELQSTPATVRGAPTNASTTVLNLTNDGSTLFFTSDDGLVPEDTDGFKDVYEWRAGTLSLVSSGRSSGDDFLIGTTPSGKDVIFKTNDQLVPQDETGGSGSIYDARVDGGFPVSLIPPACSEGSCQGTGTEQPQGLIPGSAALQHAPKRHHKKRHRHKRHHKHRSHRSASHHRGVAK
ncbi:MAG: NHL repeat-containing protein [Solirubrobacterales bacterium]